MSALDRSAFASVQTTGYSQTMATNVEDHGRGPDPPQTCHELTAAARRSRTRYSTTVSARITTSRIIAIAWA